VGGWYYSTHFGEPSVPKDSARPAPPFVLKDHSGKAHAVADFRGKLVLLHFWAAWCPPCLSEIPNLLTFAQKVAPEGKIEVVTISEDGNWPDAEKVLSSAHLPADMISLLDQDSKISDAYGTYQFPESYLIGRDGRILMKWIGAQPWNNPKAAQFLDAQWGAEKGQ